VSKPSRGTGLLEPYRRDGTESDRFDQLFAERKDNAFRLDGFTADVQQLRSAVFLLLGSYLGCFPNAIVSSIWTVPARKPHMSWTP